MKNINFFIIAPFPPLPSPLSFSYEQHVVIERDTLARRLESSMQIIQPRDEWQKIGPTGHMSRIYCDLNPLFSYSASNDCSL